MIGSPIAFHTQNVLSRSRWIDDAKINSKARYTNLSVDVIASFSNHSCYSFLERTVEIAPGQSSGSKLSSFSEMKQLSEHSCATSGTVNRNISRCNRREHDAFLARTGCQDIKASVSTVAGDRPEI